MFVYSVYRTTTSYFGELRSIKIFMINENNEKISYLCEILDYLKKEI